MYINFSVFLWTPPVEKSVDNVEKSWFSTVIFLFSPAADTLHLLHIRLHIRYEFRVPFMLCRHLSYWLFFRKFIEKVSIFPEGHLS